MEYWQSCHSLFLAVGRRLWYHRSMEIREKKTYGITAFLKICPFAHGAALLGAAILALHLLTRNDRTFTEKLVEEYIQPFHRWMAGLCAGLGRAALAEILIWAFVLLIAGLVIYRLWGLFRPGKGLRSLYALAMTLASAALLVYSGYSLLWGSYYYADDFAAEGGFEQREISVDELETVTRYFADLLNRYGEQVDRDAEGFCVVDKADIIARSEYIYENTEQLHPSLAGPDLPVKGIVSSRLLSYMDFTGFFFPFTGEACVNTDFPASLFPSTVAHELAHQRSVAREQDANFAAVLSCMESGDTDYGYSGCLLAYTYLGNALYEAAYSRWEKVYESLSSSVLLDMALNRAYWNQFETPVQTVSNSFHEGLLQSYDQELGLKSYGACVDMLVCYYLPQAQQYNAENNQISENNS